MFDKIKRGIVTASKETVTDAIKSHSKEIFAVSTLVLLGYLCIKVNGKPVNVTVNVNGGCPWSIR